MSLRGEVLAEANPCGNKHVGYVQRQSVLQTILPCKTSWNNKGPSKKGPPRISPILQTQWNPGSRSSLHWSPIAFNLSFQVLILGLHCLHVHFGTFGGAFQLFSVFFLPFLMGVLGVSKRDRREYFLGFLIRDRKVCKARGGHREPPAHSGGALGTLADCELGHHLGLPAPWPRPTFPGNKVLETKWTLYQLKTMNPFDINYTPLALAAGEFPVGSGGDWPMRDFSVTSSKKDRIAARCILLGWFPAPLPKGMCLP